MGERNIKEVGGRERGLVRGQGKTLCRHRGEVEERDTTEARKQRREGGRKSADTWWERDSKEEHGRKEGKNREKRYSTGEVSTGENTGKHTRAEREGGRARGKGTVL